MKISRNLACFIVSIILSLGMTIFLGCGGGGSDTQNKEEPTPAIKQGVFLDSAVQGIDYTTATQSGVTDAMGTFQYLDGETVTFSINGFTLGQGVAKPTMTPIDIVTGASDITDPAVTNICRLLQSLDADGNADNGIVITEAMRAEFDDNLNNLEIDSVNLDTDNTIQSLFTTLNNLGVFTADGQERKMVSAEEAQSHLNRTINGDSASTEEDLDQDGYTAAQGDCNDNDAMIKPNAAELCGDSQDNDCNGKTDCDDAACANDPACVSCTDADADQYFAEADCGTSMDCNDSNASINPDAVEVCDDGLDNDCDGKTDCDDPACANDSTCITCLDEDGDQYFSQEGCGTEVDCNDSNADINPGTVEICDDNQDNDCNGKTDADDNACSDSTDKGDWTYMVYIAGDNNLSPAAVGDINEMEKVGSSDDLTIVVQVEYSAQYSPTMPQNTLRGRITQDSDTATVSSTFTDIGNQDMGNKSTLTEFIQWAATNYPAQHYALVLWDHGAGWRLFPRTGGIMRGALEDDTSDSFMSLTDIASAVSNSQIKFDVIDFDACLMAMYEVAYEFNGLVDYMVFSEEVEAGEGDPYDLILQELRSNPKQDAETLSTTIASKYKSFYQNQDRSVATKSVVRMSQISSLHAGIGSLVALLNNNINTERPYIQTARDQSVGYDYPENHDLGHFLTQLADRTTDTDIQSKITSLQTTLANLVVSNEVYSPQSSDTILNSTGLAIYLPSRDQVTDEDLTRYAQLAINNTTRDIETNSWGSLVSNLVTGEVDQGINPLETTEGNFVIMLSWDTDADLDLTIWEPDGNFAAPYIGATSPNGFLSEDSVFSGESVEYYAANDVVEKGYYDILVEYYDDGPNTFGPTTAEVYLLDPNNGIYTFTLQNRRLMDLSNIAPYDWFDYEDEITNVYNDVYSDWWMPHSIERSPAVQNVPLQPTGKYLRLRLDLNRLSTAKKPKHLLRLDKEDLDFARQYIQRHQKTGD